MGHILIANVVSMIIGLFNSFMLPKFLSIDTYAVVKTYNLYITYANIFCFGYNEGMYLKYGGKNIKAIDKEDLSSSLFNFLYLEIAAFLLVFSSAVILNSFVLCAFAFGMFSFNIITYLKSLYQATGEFSQYGKSLNYEKLGIFILNVILMFILKSDNYMLYIGVQVLVEAVIGTYLFLSLRKRLELPLHFKMEIFEIKSNVKNGFVLMIGNFSSSIFVGLDRWFVKILLTSVHFAYYSFAASIESLINVFITPITISLYNTFCKGIDDKQIKLLKNLIVIWCYAIIAVAFPIKWIIINYLSKYQDALDIIFILLVAQPFYGIIKGIYVNIFKANKQQNYYMKQMLFMTIIAIILNCVFFIFSKSIVSIAMATLITSIIWLLLCETKSKYQFSVTEYLSIFIFTTSFLVYSGFENPLVGLLFYVITCVLTGYLFMRSSLTYMISLGVNKVKQFYKR